MIYFLLPILTFFTAQLKILNIKGSKTLVKLLMVSVFMFYALFVGLRGEGVGTDYYQYEGFFNDPSFTEPGFGLFMRIVKLFTSNFSVFLLLNILFTLYLRYYLFDKFSYNKAISYLMLSGFWLLVYDMNGIRQALSLGFVGIAGYFAYKENLIKFLIFAAIASLIHYSSIVFIPFYFILKVDINKRQMIFSILILYLLAIANISGVIMEAIMNSGLKGVLVGKITAYSEIDQYNRNALLSFNTFHRIFIFFVIFFTIDRIPAPEKLKKFLLMAAFLNISIFLLLSRFELIAVRGSLPFRYFELVFFSYLPYIFKQRQLKFFVLLLLLLYVCFQIFQTLNVSSDVDNTLIPYKTIFG